MEFTVTVATFIITILNSVLILNLFSDSKKFHTQEVFEYDDEQIIQRDYSVYNDRIARIKQEIDPYVNAKNDAVPYDSNVVNLPHSIIGVEDDMYPSVENEKECAYVETSR